MMRSLFSGVAGLRNHQTRMDVIGNNIANVNTTGFKASRVNFQDILSQTLSGASSAQGTRGGTNPMQVGLGVGLASIDTLFTDGSYQSTGKQTDLSVQGQGLFVVSDNDGLSQYYTRAGNFDFDAAGNYVIPGTGLKVLGYGIDKTTKEPDTSKLVPLQITDADKVMAPSATTKMTFAKNLSAEAVADNPATTGVTDPTTVTSQILVYDQEGKETTLTAKFTKTANANEWTLDFYDAAGLAASPVTVLGTTTITFDATTDPTATPPTTAGKLSTGSTGNIDLGTPYGKFDYDLTGLTEYGGESTVKSTSDGYAAGAFDKYSISASGMITGIFDNGQTKDLGQVAVANCTNPAGLNKVGSNLYSESKNSGKVTAGIAGAGDNGEISAGTLEMSNVDLAQQFSDMIITQRGFQANSKIITTSDEMLEILANLKR